jgi:hypothetical protein
MLVADPRFAEHFDEIPPGLAAFVRDTFVGNVEREGAA